MSGTTSFSSSQAAAIDALQRTAFILERQLAESYRVKAFRGAVDAISQLDGDDFDKHVKAGTVQKLAGVGAKSEQIIVAAAAGDTPEYLSKLEADPWPPEMTPEAAALRQAIKGDCHTHSTWSDGGSPIIEMARTAKALGHEYMVLTDHSPRLTVANGLSAERLVEQVGVVMDVNDELEAEGGNQFRLLTGIEVDILDRGSLDQHEQLLEKLDLVVASVHSKLRMDSKDMTKRMITAVENPNTDVLGHCTGRKVMGKERPQSQFDAKAVFEACRDSNTAVEINCRPERTDPPDDLLQLAFDIGCMFSIDTDSHAPGQLDFMVLGCIRAAAIGITADRVINTKSFPSVTD